LAGYLRTVTYKERSRDYVAAASLLGASNLRMIFHHVLPNTLSTLVTFLPFTVMASISALNALDFLAFGLPPPTPSWGDLLREGISQLHAPWIILSAFCVITIVLLLVSFVGEAIRDAFDPKKFTTYR
jgi:microcin C transport system permease protein